MPIIIFVTAKNSREANKIAAKLVESKLIACANVIKGVHSIFRWQGKIDKANETLLILKSKRSCLPKVIKMVKKYHSYDVPEIIALPMRGFIAPTIATQRTMPSRSTTRDLGGHRNWPKCEHVSGSLAPSGSALSRPDPRSTICLRDGKENP